MNIPTPSNPWFSPTRQQRDLIVKSIGHYTECDCSTQLEIAAASEVLDIIRALNGATVIGLEDIADSWNRPYEVDEWE